jgi:hypothetical protein
VDEVGDMAEVALEGITSVREQHWPTRLSSHAG